MCGALLHKKRIELTALGSHGATKVGIDKRQFGFWLIVFL
jgi:hypothetical protein